MPVAIWLASMTWAEAMTKLSPLLLVNCAAQGDQATGWARADDSDPGAIDRICQ
jgi:hypothetical protein